MKISSKFLWAFLLLIPVFSCKKDSLVTDASAKLEFSEDSILFDTVFTTIGSTTHQFKIYNRNNKAIKISSIKLAGGRNSNFRMNVDGVNVVSTNDIEIPPKDSLFVFVEVTVDPNNQNSPLVISDSILFETNGNMQQVNLEAWGQDAYYYRPPASLIDCNIPWTNDKPHVIYGYAIVDSACKLTILPGTQVYLHKNAVLWIYKDATLDIQGNFSSPVVFQGDRLEQEYQDIPGQWGKIWLSAGSKNNTIDWAIIKNGGIGIHADTLGASVKPTLRISNTIIKNMSAAALFAQGSSIRGYNCVFANCGEYVAALTIGGSYGFTHCTFANYWSNGNRQKPLLLLNNWYKDVNNALQIRNLDSAYFRNCIVYGNIINEIGLDSSTYGGVFNFEFQNCLLRISPDINTAGSYHFNTVYKNEDPAFIDYATDDYSLTSESSAINRGDIIVGNSYPTDLNKNSRTQDGAPDIGAYEYKP